MLIIICSEQYFDSMKSDIAKVLVQALALSNYGINGFCQILLSKGLKTDLLNFLDTVLLLPYLSKVLGFLRYIGLIKYNHLHVRMSYLD